MQSWGCAGSFGAAQRGWGWNTGVMLGALTALEGSAALPRAPLLPLLTCLRLPETWVWAVKHILLKLDLVSVREPSVSPGQVL